MKNILQQRLVLFFLGLLLPFCAAAQQTFPVNGPYDERPDLYAFINATIVVDYQTVLPNATLIVNKGVIEAVGSGIAVSKGAKVIDLKGKYIYPAFIDLYTDYGIPNAKTEQVTGGFGEQFVSKKEGAYNWNQAVKPELRGQELFVAHPLTAKTFRNLGFGSVLSHQDDGIARGSSVLVTLSDEKEQKLVLKGEVAAHYSFNKGTSTQSYPSSLMGSVALLRQTYLDANWYKSGQGREYNISLDAWNRLQELPQIFEVSNKFDALRADKIGDEFGKQYIIKGAGDEYQRLAEIKATGAALIIPVNFPEAYDVSDPYETSMLSLADMKHWEMAPANPAMLSAAGIEFAITTYGLKSKSDFMANMQKAIEHGLDKKAALKALTYTPARLVKAEQMIGSLKKGMVANFIITSKEIFEKNNVILENWIQGKQHVLKEQASVDLRGTYRLKIGATDTLTLKVGGELEKQDFKIVERDSVQRKVTATVNGELVTLIIDSADKNNKSKIRLSGWVGDRRMQGEGQLVDGTWIKWMAAKTAEFKPEDKKQPIPEGTKPEIGKVIFPFIAYGSPELPKAELVLIKNATVWTNEADGVLKNTDVLINNGKIQQIGRNLTAADAKVIDGTGKHLTAGVIDEHSHIAISRAVNEGVNANSAEVRVGDVINPEDINIYRQLAGGVVAAQLLHGSANPIGGQSALVKLRWGVTPDAMKIQDADGFIKFALGENVKHSNWGSFGTTRFPQTRMGVEQVYLDAFTRAREYEKARLASPQQTRRDLSLEALVEILNKKRFITCHSYVQSEINMLMKVAEEFNFRINTFTHILEGYKVADKMKAHGVNASSFADWWAYKYEVIDAIPYNAALMTKQGITTAINSDDAEMGRRLNQEAAKSVKYGNMSEEDALKMVTLNPARMLHLDGRMGSIKVGKDADVVLWSENPLSIYTKAEKTFVDGILYYDIEKDQRMRDEIRAERNRLIQKMLAAKQGGATVQKPVQKAEHIWHCEDLTDAWRTEE